DVPGALRAVGEAVKLAPRLPAALALLALAEAKAEKSEDAIAHAEAALNLDRNLAEAYHARGLAEDQLLRFDAATARLARAVELEPKDAAIRVALGTARLHAAGNKAGPLRKQAREDAEAARALDPKLAEAWVLRGLARTTREDLDS